jgi:hypothetical protein
MEQFQFMTALPRRLQWVLAGSAPAQLDELIRGKAVSTPSRRTVSPGLVALIVGVLLYALVQALYFPGAIGIKDESSYLSMAYILRSGTVYADVAHVSVWSATQVGSHLIPKYPPGEGALLLVATLFNWRTSFLVTMLLHLVGTVAVARLLMRLGLRVEFALLYLFFPPLVLFSRTVMAEIPSAALTAVALLLFLAGSRRRMIAGLLLGLAIFLRYQNGFTLLLFLLGAVTHDLVRSRSAGDLWRHPLKTSSVPLPLGMLPGLALFVAYNLATSGSPVIPGYVGRGSFGAGYFSSNLRFYAVDLLLLFPLMLITPVLYRGQLRAEIISLTIGMTLLMSTYYYIDRGHGFAEDALTGMRLLLPVAPAWIIAYSWCLERALTHLPLAARVVRPGLIIAGVIGALAVTIPHQHHLRDAVKVRDLIYSRTQPSDIMFINDETTKFVTPGWGSRTYTLIRPNLVPIGSDRAPVSIVYSDKGDNGPTEMQQAEHLAARVGASLVVDEKDGWRVMIWRTDHRRT